MAEQALACYELNESDDAVFPAAAQRIRRAREALTLTQDDVADRWGEQPSMYWDLELFDDEAFTVISVRQLQRLASVLKTSLNVLLFGKEPPLPLPTVPYPEVIARLEDRMIRDAVSVEQLGDRIGWDLQPLVTDPRTVGDLSVAALWYVCRAIDLDWVSVMNATLEGGPLRPTA